MINSKKYEQKLALKITIIFILLFIFSFIIFIYLNFKLSIFREEKIFLDNLKLVPSKYVINLIEKKQNFKRKWNKIYSKIFKNYIIRIWKKSFSGWFFLDYNENIFNKLKNKEIRIFHINQDYFLVYKLKKENIEIIVWKNINYIFYTIKRLKLISIIIILFSSFIIYFVSYKLAKKTTKNIREVNKKLSQYNHNLAHELKTPLSVIKSDLELLEMWRKLDLDLLYSSKKEIINMQEIIDNLLFLSESEANLEKEEIDLNNEIKEIINKYFWDFREKIFISWVNIKKNFNKKLFDILIRNLLENAIKYSKKDEKIEIFLEKKYLIIQNKIDKNQWKIDTKKLFDTFYKLDNSRNSSWYWIWLSIVKKIIDLHNYKINIEIKKDLFIVKINF